MEKGPNEYYKFDMGRICEYFFLLVLGIIVIMAGRTFYGPDPINNPSIIGVSIVIAGIGIIILTIVIAIVLHYTKQDRATL